MTAMTLDALSAGRFVLGIGPSGPQVVEGWHGVAYGKPCPARQCAVKKTHFCDRYHIVSATAELA
jgi:hypothetical protein